MDLRDSYLGEKYSHATVMRRIFDLNPKEYDSDRCEISIRG